MKKNYTTPTVTLIEISAQSIIFTSVGTNNAVGDGVQLGKQRHSGSIWDDGDDE